MRFIFLSMLLFSALLAMETYLDYFPDAVEKFTFIAEKRIIDVAVDEVGDVYVLTESAESLFVQKLSDDGKPKAFYRCSKGPTPRPIAVRIEISRKGETVLVQGIDKELNTPINWVFDSTGNDILPVENVLKYAEWLQVSPSGKYFTCQGYDTPSRISDVYDISWKRLKWNGQMVYHALFVGSSGESDLLLMTEPDTGGKAFSLTELPSQKAIFKEPMWHRTALLTAHKGRAILLDDCVVMNAPFDFGGVIYGFDSKNGKMIWHIDPFAETIHMARSFEGNEVVLVGSYCIQILNAKGEDLSHACFADFEGMKPFYPGILDVSFWAKRKILLATVYYHGFPIPIRTGIITFDDSFKAQIPQGFPLRVEGFVVGGSQHLLCADERELKVFRLP